MSKKIIGVTVGSPLPKPDFLQNNPAKGDYIKNKPDYEGLEAKVKELEEFVGESKVSDQIIDAIKSIDYPVDSVNGKTGEVILTAADVGANKTEASETNGNIKIDGEEVVVYTHPEKHTIAEVTGLQDELDGKVDVKEGWHLMGPVEREKLDRVFPVEASEINGNILIDSEEVVVYTHPEKHAIADVDGLQAALDEKQAAGNYAAEEHTHDLSEIVGIEEALSHKEEAGAAAWVQDALEAYQGTNDAAVKKVAEDLAAEAETARAAEKANADAIAGILGKPESIIDVVRLPDTNIRDDCFYRLVTASFVENGIVYKNWTCYCVESLPNSGEPAFTGDLTNPSTVVVTAYYLISNESVNAYVTKELATVFGVSSGWYPVTTLMAAVGYTFLGATTDGKIANGSREGEFYVLLDYVLYNYKNGNWTSYKKLSWAGSGTYAEVFNSIDNVASGIYSHAEGRFTTASGTHSHAEGRFTTASGHDSHAEGTYTTASGGWSHAEGYETTASGSTSHAEGCQSTAFGVYSHAEGCETIASGDCSHAEGHYTEASGDYSHAEGRYTEASGDYSHAEGYETTASGEYSHAEGESSCKVSKTITDNPTIDNIQSAWSTAKFLLASGTASHAEGKDTLALNHYSHAEGCSTAATGRSQHVQGEYNALDPETDQLNRGKYAHIVGNGTDKDNRSNAHTLDWDGVGWFAGGLKVGGTGQDDVNAKEVALKEYVDEKMNTALNAVQSDYAQNDTTAPDYVKNRLAWSEYYETETFIFPETTIAIVNTEYIQDGICGLQEGATYVVNWNGIRYECKCASYVERGYEEEDSFELLFIGNPIHAGIGKDTGEPFVIFDIPIDNQCYFITIQGDGDYTISINELKETVHKIDPKYYDRLGWVDTIQTEIFPETAITTADNFYNGEGVIGLQNGKNYIVKFDNTKYECKCFEVNDNMNIIPCLGNPAILGLASDTNEPFLIAENTVDNIFMVAVTLDGEYSLSIIENAEYVHKIHEKYIPDKITNLVETGKGLILPETVINSENNMTEQFGTIELVGGETYIVSYNGVEFEVVCQKIVDEGMTGYILGNGALVEPEMFDNTGEPFVIMELPGYSIFAFVSLDVLMDPSTTATISVNKLKHVINKSYLSDITWDSIGLEQEEIFNQTLSGFASNGGIVEISPLFQLIEEQEYEVIWDGVSYIDVYDGYGIGSALSEKYNYPFYIVPNDNGIYFVAVKANSGGSSELDSSADTHTVIIKIHNVTQIPTKYIQHIQDDVDRKLEVKTEYKEITLPNSNYTSVAYGNGKFVAVSDAVNGKVIYSEDGITWVNGKLIYSSGDGTWNETTMVGNYTSVAYGNGRFVAVNNDGKVIYSEDGITWNAITVVNASYSSIIYSNGKFIALGNNGRVSCTEDGTNWASSDLGFNVNGNYTSIAHGDGKFVAVSHGLVVHVMYSEDGSIWNTSNITGDYTSVAYGNGRFVVFDNNGKVMYSEDGITWSETAKINPYYRSITYGNGKFVVVGEDHVAYSEDGITWNEASKINTSCNSVTYGNGKFVTVGEDHAAYSEDGITWNNAIACLILSQNDTDVTAEIKDLLNIPKIETAEIGQTLIIKSVDENGKPTEWEAAHIEGADHEHANTDVLDGITAEQVAAWDAKLELVAQIIYEDIVLPGNHNLSSVTYGNGKFVAISIHGIVVYSEDGITWFETTMPSSRCYSVTYGNGKFVAVGYPDQVVYSEDGINWFKTVISGGVDWRSVTYGNGKFVAVAYNSDKSAYSEDGINWSETTMSSNYRWNSVTYGNGKFVAVTSNSNKAAYSEDGVAWTETTMPRNQSWGAVTYGNGKFVVIPYLSNILAYSEDGINWSETTMSSGYMWNSVTYGNGKFVAVTAGSEGKAAYSEDGITWVETTMHSSQDWRSVTYGNGKFVAVAYNSDKPAYSEDGITWSDKKEIRTQTISQNNIDVTEDIKTLLSIPEIQAVTIDEINALFQ